MGAQVAILLGQLGIHKFILGYTNAGIIMLAVTLVSYVLTFVLMVSSASWRCPRSASPRASST